MTDPDITANPISAFAPVYQKEGKMNRTVLLTAVALCLLGFSGQAYAQSDTDTISVTVSLADVLSIDVSPDTWTIGDVALGGIVYPNSLDNHSVANNGTVMADVSIQASDGANGWVIGGTPGIDTFSVRAHLDTITLATTPTLLESDMAANTGTSLDLNYYSPTGDTQGGGVDHSFTITITATQSP